MEDSPGRDRPSDFDNQALLAAVEEDERLTTQMRAENFNVDHSKIVRCLKKLGKVWKLTGWVPHELSDKNKTDLVRIFTELVQRNEQSIANKEWGLLPHPPYSLTEAPTDYHGDRSLKNWQVNKICDDLNDLVTDVEARIAPKNSNFLAHGIDCLPCKWEAVKSRW